MLLGLLAQLPPASVDATTVTFNFNTVLDGATSPAVQSYMQGVLNTNLPGKTVTVTGARGELNYNGDGHVVGKTRTYSETLGTTDGAHWAMVSNVWTLVNDAGQAVTSHYGSARDAFIVTDSFGSPPATKITIVFSFKVNWVTFDYEIFPDGTCTSTTSCGTNQSNWPDFKFKADGTLYLHTPITGSDPGSITKAMMTPGTGMPSTSPYSATERAPQYLGTSATFFFPNGATTLEFIDWPVMIGIDNLVVGVPEPPPAVLALVALALTGCLVVARRRSRRSVT